MTSPSASCLHMGPRKFRAGLRVAMEELKDCKARNGAGLSPLFAPETRIEIRVRDGPPCEVLTVVKATNSRLFQPRNVAEVLVVATTTLAPVSTPTPTAQKRPIARLRAAPAISEVMEDEHKPVCDRNVPPSDTRRSAERKVRVPPAKGARGRQLVRSLRSLS